MFVAYNSTIYRLLMIVSRKRHRKLALRTSIRVRFYNNIYLKLLQLLWRSFILSLCIVTATFMSSLVLLWLWLTFLFSLPYGMIPAWSRNNFDDKKATQLLLLQYNTILQYYLVFSRIMTMTGPWHFFSVLASFPRDLEKYDKKAQYDYFTSTLDNNNNNNNSNSNNSKQQQQAAGSQQISSSISCTSWVLRGNPNNLAWMSCGDLLQRRSPMRSSSWSRQQVSCALLQFRGKSLRKGTWAAPRKENMRKGKFKS